MPIFCQKRSFCQKHGALMSYFQICNEKPPAVLPIFGQKTINYTKTALDYNSISSKKSFGCRFCPISTKFSRLHQFKDHLILKWIVKSF